RLALERGSSAREGLEVITALLERHGQGGSCKEEPVPFVYHNTFLLADRSEAWLLETAGRYWAAQRIRVCPHSLPQCVPTATHSSPQCVPTATPHLTPVCPHCHPHLTQSVPTPHPSVSPLPRARLAVLRWPCPSPAGHITEETLMSILRDKASGICVDSEGFRTAGSMVSVLPRDPALPCVHFLTGTPDPSR
ncbi:SCRN2 protein, partial [Emberiza fucata]|nr:SCRN2 protein [Emberiza fucata]